MDLRNSTNSSSHFSQLKLHICALIMSNCVWKTFWSKKIAPNEAEDLIADSIYVCAGNWLPEFLDWFSTFRFLWQCIFYGEIISNSENSEQSAYLPRRDSELSPPFHWKIQGHKTTTHKLFSSHFKEIEVRKLHLLSDFSFVCWKQTATSEKTSDGDSFTHASRIKNSIWFASQNSLLSFTKFCIKWVHFLSSKLVQVCHLDWNFLGFLRFQCRNKGKDGTNLGAVDLCQKKTQKHTQQSSQSVHKNMH